MNKLDNNIRSAYKKLLEKSRELEILSSVSSIIGWDMETKMPPRAVEQRSQQLSLMSRIGHQMATSPEIGRLIKEITSNREYESLNELEKRNLFLIKKDYEEQTQLPEKLVGELAKQHAITVNTWKKAKAKKDFSLLKPELAKLIKLNTQMAEILQRVKQTKTTYDALIDNYEPKMTSESIATIFDTLRKGLMELVEKIQNTQEQPDTSILQIPIPIEKQKTISQALTKTLGYDTASPKAGGRIDETEHPFTSGYYDDVRITTHYFPDNYASAIFSVLHEAGHAIYEQNQNPKWKYQPIGSIASYGFHESQSRFFENIIGRSSEFWSSFFPKMKKIAHPNLANIEIDQFIHAINAVKPSKIRIEADEVTYSLHVIIRFQIEKELFADKIKINELPEIWNEKYSEYLGVHIENDSEGVMQDTHWASGYYGYFPSYALGNIYSGQILKALSRENREWRTQIAQNKLGDIKRWLIRKVHMEGNLYDPEDLIKRITGNDIEAKPYLEYLKEKYRKLYGF